MLLKLVVYAAVSVFSVSAMSQVRGPINLPGDKAPPAGRIQTAEFDIHKVKGVIPMSQDEIHQLINGSDAGSFRAKSYTVINVQMVSQGQNTINLVALEHRLDEYGQLNTECASTVRTYLDHALRVLSHDMPAPFSHGKLKIAGKKVLSKNGGAYVWLVTTGVKSCSFYRS